MAGIKKPSVGLGHMYHGLPDELRSIRGTVRGLRRGMDAAVRSLLAILRGQPG